MSAQLALAGGAGGAGTGGSTSCAPVTPTHHPAHLSFNSYRSLRCVMMGTGRCARTKDQHAGKARRGGEAANWQREWLRAPAFETPIDKPRPGTPYAEPRPRAPRSPRPRTKPPLGLALVPLHLRVFIKVKVHTESIHSEGADTGC